MSELPFEIITPSGDITPVVVSVPHCGTSFPEELKELYKPDMIEQPDDTDWFVHQLYDFALEKGVTLIRAKYSRWVIDLNRDPDSKPLYNDGRIITALTPTTDFFGNEIYREGNEPSEEGVTERLDKYYWPYYRAIEKLLADRKDRFGQAVLWDAHSIRRLVPTIRKEPFPDMILGTNDGQSAEKGLMDIALNTLRKGPYQVNYNDPFKGGHITRYFGKPEDKIYGLQLEMNKILYMDDEELAYHPGRADKVREVLSDAFDNILNHLDTA